MKETNISTAKADNKLEILNEKLDIILDELDLQKRRRAQVDDLMKDVSIIGKDLFETTVSRLDKAGIEVNGDDLEKLLLKIIRNISTFNILLDTFESANDLIKDLSPVIRQAGLDLIKKLHDLEEKGYFVFINELLNILDRIVTHFKAEDLRMLADNIVIILETIKNLTQPDMLKSINNAMSIYKDVYTEEIKEVSMLKALRMMNSKDGKRAMGFIMTLLMNTARFAEKNK
jgi:uncharacterized protein YjgD (DUF1641 family)